MGIVEERYKNSHHIGPNDVISGKTYLKLLNDFKVYNDRRNRIIEELQNKIQFLYNLIEKYDNGEAKVLSVAEYEVRYKELQDKFNTLLNEKNILLDIVYEKYCK